jgi:hypothetical protein
MSVPQNLPNMSGSKTLVQLFVRRTMRNKMNQHLVPMHLGDYVERHLSPSTGQMHWYCGWSGPFPDQIQKLLKVP